MSDSTPTRHVAYEQVKTMLDFMGQHVEFAAGTMRSLEARHASKQLWRELATKLNNCRGGTRKTADGWSKYWSDFKNKLKNKVRLLKKKRLCSASKNIRPLTKLEKRALVILGPHFQQNIVRVNVDTFSNSEVPPEVKLEVFQENAKDYCKLRSDSIDKLTDGEANSEASVESGPGEYVDESDHNSSSDEPLLQSIFPKWLIEVEKKRADAELVRAKAEEQRVKIAAKNAEASIIQAEALKKLSEAATMQADAIMRIAMVLERKHREDLLPI